MFTKSTSNMLKYYKIISLSSCLKIACDSFDFATQTDVRLDFRRNLDANRFVRILNTSTLKPADCFHV